jgi:hypothetical protein
MIILFEPQCTGYAHEQFNAGLLYGYSLAYPQETIVFFGEREHIKCVKSVFNSANLSINKIEFIETEVPRVNNLSRISVIFEYYRIFKKLLDYASENNCNKIIFLSIYSYNLLSLKMATQLIYKDTFRFHIMMHGALEHIKNKNLSVPFDLPVALFNRLRKSFNLAKLDFKIKPTNKYLYEKLFKLSLQLFGNENITYYVFREDSRRNVKKYLPNIQQYFKSIDLPYIYKDTLGNNEVVSLNKKVFASIGQGNIFAVREAVRKLNNGTNIGVDNFEIRIIGPTKIRQDDLGLIKYIDDGQVLSRGKIEEKIEDIQFILFFYDPDSYELTTSGAFFDAIAYCKPMIFIKNHCFDYYYENYKFGYRCEDINEMVAVMRKVSVKHDDYQRFCSEIKRMQNDTSVSNNYCKLMFEV